MSYMHNNYKICSIIHGKANLDYFLILKKIKNVIYQKNNLRFLLLNVLCHQRFIVGISQISYILDIFLRYRNCRYFVFHVYCTFATVVIAYKQYIHVFITMRRIMQSWSTNSRYGLDEKQQGSLKIKRKDNKRHTMNWFLIVCLMVFNATFNNFSVISWRSVL